MIPWKSPNPIWNFPHPLYCREDCMDGDSLQSQILEDEYGLRRIPLRAGDLVIDAGGYIGAVSALALSLGARVIAIEPSSSNCELFRANTRTWADRVTLHHGALTSQDAPVQLLQRSQATEYGRMNRHVTFTALPSYEMDPTLHETVPAVHLDAILGGVDRVHLLKMDIEGAEFDVLGTLTPANLAKIERLVLEIHSPDGDIEGAFKRICAMLPGMRCERRHLLDAWFVR